MAWCKLEATLRESVKPKRLARKLGIERHAARGLLAGLWSWALTYAPDGDLSGLEPEDIAEAADWPGDADVFFTALVDVGLIDHDGYDSARIHNWLARSGSYAENARRNKNRQKDKAKRLSRDGPGTVPGRRQNCPGSVPGVSQARIEENRREKKRIETIAVTKSPTSLLVSADDAPQQTDRNSDGLNHFSNLREIEGAGYDRYGSLTGGAIAAVRNLLPITRDELDAAKSTKGKSWAYMAKVIANYREQNNETANSLAAVDASDAGDFIDDFYEKWGPNGTERPQEF